MNTEYNRKKVPGTKLGLMTFRNLPNTRVNQFLTPGEVSEVIKRMKYERYPTKALDYVNWVMSQSGIESFTMVRGLNRRTFYYVNTGDTYTVTLCYCSQTSTYFLDSMGGIVERYNKTGYRDA